MTLENLLDNLSFQQRQDFDKIGKIADYLSKIFA